MTRIRNACSIQGCARPYYAKGWCSKHYQQARAEGEAADPDASTGRHKLSRSDALEIRARYTAGGITLRALGLEYGVGRTTVWHIVHQLTWK
jgi:hypothetical protein